MLQLKVEAIKWETADTATFYFTEVTGRKVNYLAGQFITLVFTHHNEEIRRSYSLSSSPDKEMLAITVKRITNGEISRFLLSKVRPGDQINAIEPAGRFIVTDFNARKDIVFFAAGSGIVPVFSQLKYILNREGHSYLTLIYSNQDSGSVLFAADLVSLQARHGGRLNIINLLSSEGNRLNNITVEQLVKQNIRFKLNKAKFYLCGPFAYMRMVRLTLLYMGLESSRIRKENFVLDTVPVAAGYINYPPQKIRIHFNNELYDLVVGENQTILQAALQNKIALPYSCCAGMCSACTAKCITGKVDMAVNDVLTDLDLAHGLILTCTGHPVGDDVVIEFL
ncbi:ferredoxin--NADP reductase [Mucilaginibacter sp. UR6-11]|uniref:ferredoxin--NADP reductase n=1 Tax=Mucilaginibacter sp. UR6-11 TaxID=1435644 RepID=UPI001E620AEA|nr:ferredoxin--NADP reductase [Mucilaginibacter sp. UR6-11]MCC8426559.1 ferredoxin--NADP reductase [Mucilaginibacter sp. UR6-11]